MEYVFANEQYGNGMIAAECEEVQRYVSQNEAWVRFKGLKRNLMLYEAQLEPMSIDMIEEEPDLWAWKTVKYFNDSKTLFRIFYSHLETEYQVKEFHPNDDYSNARRVWLMNLFIQEDARIKDFILEYFDSLVDLLDWIQ